jgi:hypothetical protein
MYDARRNLLPGTPWLGQGKIPRQTVNQEKAVRLGGLQISSFHAPPSAQWADRSDRRQELRWCG